MTKIFTGVGSRSTPTEILTLMRKASKKLCLEGYVLRSGGAEGSDDAFEKGWGDSFVDADSVNAEIYLPWDGFNGRVQDDVDYFLIKNPNIINQARLILKDIHPAYDKLTRGPLALHTRNIFQVLGADLKTPTRFVIAYAKLDKKGKPQGGTATAINLAILQGIPVHNLILPEIQDRLNDYVNKDS